LPTTTLPKPTLVGATVSSATAADVAVALRPMATEGLLALLVIETVPVSVPAETGLYVTVTFAVCPGANVAGAVSPEVLIPVPEIVILEIAADALPVFSK